LAIQRQCWLSPTSIGDQVQPLFASINQSGRTCIQRTFPLRCIRIVSHRHDFGSSRLVQLFENLRYASYFKLSDVSKEPLATVLRCSSLVTKHEPAMSDQHESCPVERMREVTFVVILKNIPDSSPRLKRDSRR
jgi:hypothetical protein